MTGIHVGLAALVVHLIDSLSVVDSAEFENATRDLQQLQPEQQAMALHRLALARNFRLWRALHNVGVAVPVDLRDAFYMCNDIHDRAIEGRPIALETVAAAMHSGLRAADLARESADGAVGRRLVAVALALAYAADGSAALAVDVAQHAFSDQLEVSRFLLEEAIGVKAVVRLASRATQ